MNQAYSKGHTFELGEVSAYADAAAKVLGLTLAEPHRQGVITNLRMILNQTADLMAFELDWTDEVAVVFEP